MKNPQVSIIVPIYNVANYLKECLQSIVKQSYVNLDIVLVDDGSSDESLDIALEFAKQDERIFVVSKPNGGLSSARNTGLEFIKGSALRGVFECSNKSSLRANEMSVAKRSFFRKQGKTEVSLVIQNSQIQNVDCHAFVGTNARNDKVDSPSLAEGDKGGGYDDSLKSKVQSVSTTQNPPPNPLRKGGGLKDCHADFDNSTRNDGVSVDCHDSSLFNKSLKSRNDIKIQSLTQTHSFEKAYKIITAQEINAHFTQIAPNFIKSDLERINDFITQELPHNAPIHFVDSDDMITSDCIEICVQNLLAQNLDIAVHNWSVLDEASGQTKKGEYLANLKTHNYNTGLDLLAHNKIYDFYFSPQGLFRAEILNRYGLRYTEGIYHEDHDFGTLLFCLAGKVGYIDAPLYIYRARSGSITNNQKQAAFPAQIPSFLEPLRGDFSDYKSLRAYFKSYCFVRVGFNIWEFYTQKSAKDGEFRQRYQNFFRQIALSYMRIFKSPLTPDTMGVKALLQKMNFGKCLVWREFFKDLHRQPKKIRYITNIKYLLSKDTR